MFTFFWFCPLFCSNCTFCGGKFRLKLTSLHAQCIGENNGIHAFKLYRYAVAYMFTNQFRQGSCCSFSKECHFASCENPSWTSKSAILPSWTKGHGGQRGSLPSSNMVHFCEKCRNREISNEVDFPIFAHHQHTSYHLLDRLPLLPRGITICADIK